VRRGEKEEVVEGREREERERITSGEEEGRKGEEKELVVTSFY